MRHIIKFFENLGLFILGMIGVYTLIIAPMWLGVTLVNEILYAMATVK